MRILMIALMPLSLALAGCVSTIASVVTMPVKAVSKTADVLTTSQSEADEKRGRAVRKREECIGKEDRRAREERREPDLAKCDR